VKFLIVTPLAGALGYPLRVAAQAGVALAQTGEFSFVLALVARDHGLLSNGVYQTFLAEAWSPCSSPVPDPDVRLRRGPAGTDPGPEALLPGTDLLRSRGADLLRGGPPGPHRRLRPERRNLAKVLSRWRSLPRLELNAESVKRAAKEGEPIVYGDSTSREVLKKMGIRRPGPW